MVGSWSLKKKDMYYVPDWQADLLTKNKTQPSHQFFAFETLDWELTWVEAEENYSSPFLYLEDSDRYWAFFQYIAKKTQRKTRFGELQIFPSLKLVTINAWVKRTPPASITFAWPTQPFRAFRFAGQHQQQLVPGRLLRCLIRPNRPEPASLKIHFRLAVQAIQAEKSHPLKWYPQPARFYEIKKRGVDCFPIKWTPKKMTDPVMGVLPLTPLPLTMKAELLTFIGDMVDQKFSTWSELWDWKNKEQPSSYRARNFRQSRHFHRLHGRSGYGCSCITLAQAAETLQYLNRLGFHGVLTADLSLG